MYKLYDFFQYNRLYPILTVQVMQVMSFAHYNPIKGKNK